MALAPLQALGESALTAQVQFSVASTLYQGVRDWSAAEEWSRKAAETYRILDDAYGEAKAQAMQAAALMEMGPSAEAHSSPSGTSDNLAQARELLTHAASFHEDRGEDYDAALATNNLGVAHYLSGQYAEATVAYRTA